MPVKHNRFLFLACRNCRDLVFWRSHQVIRNLGISLSLSYRPRVLPGIAAVALVLAGMSAPALAARHHRHAATTSFAAMHAGHRVLASPTDPDKDAALIVDGATGKVLYGRNESAERHPASLTK